jgi:hypothetical protein
VASVNSDAQTWIRAYPISRTQNFPSEGRLAREGASRKGARPCPQRACCGCVTLTFPYGTSCKDQPVQGSWAVWDGVMRYVDELRVYGVLRSSAKWSSPKFALLDP